MALGVYFTTLYHTLIIGLFSCGELLKWSWLVSGAAGPLGLAVLGKEVDESFRRGPRQWAGCQRTCSLSVMGVPHSCS